MTAMPDPDHEQRLADLSDALRVLGRYPTDDECAALAQRHGVPAADALACRRAIHAIATCLAPAAPAVEEMSLPDTYEVLGELGRGGMGVVFRARHRALGREVAIKVLQPGESSFQELLRRFETEARSLARLRHPHIVAVHDVGRSGGHVWYTMDLIEGTSLDKALKQGAMPPSRAVRIMTDVVSAIEHSHAHGVIHRDLKPANILLDARDAAFVADFGLARDRNVAVELTTTGQIMGTPAYMSPEAMRGDGLLVGERTDVWALGAMLYETLTGVSPFHRSNFADTMQAVLREEPVAVRKRNPGVPRDLELVCHKALAKAPDERYATAQALREDLARFQQGLPVLAQRPDLRRRFGRWFARNRAAVIGAMVSSVLVGIVAFAIEPAARTPDAIDATIRRAGDREQKADYAGALELYELARGVLGRDADRALRHGGGVTSSSLVAHVWRGILTCRAELAWQRVAGGDGVAAAAEYAEWLRQCTPDQVFRRDEFVGELAALQVMAGDPAAAADTLRAALASLSAAGEDPTAAPTALAWGVIVRRLRPVWRDPAHERWRAAGRLLATALVFAAERPFDLRLADFDATPALVAAWSGVEALAMPARERLRALVRTVALRGDAPLQWGGAELAAARALVSLVDDRTLAGAVRNEALDLLCAVADLPWRPAGDQPGLVLEGGRGATARALALRCFGQPRDEAWRDRVTFAVDLLGDGDGNAIDVRAWLAAHTGADAGTDFAAWWRAHRADDPAAALRTALGERAVEARGEAVGRHFADLSGVDRARYHHWLCLRAAADVCVPLWPAGEPEPANLVASWSLGVRREGERFFCRIECSGLRADASGWENGATSDSALDIEHPLNTWMSFGVGSLADAVSPTLALGERVPRLRLGLPGAVDVVSWQWPLQRFDVQASVSLRERMEFRWNVDCSSPPLSERWRTVDTGPEAFDTFGVRVVDGWFGGWDGECGGPRVCAFLAGRTDGVATQAATGWRGQVIEATAMLRRLAAAGDRAGFVAAMSGDGPAARSFEVVGRIPAQRVGVELPVLRDIDAMARSLRESAGLDAGRRDRLAVALAARLQAGDGSVLAEAGFPDRLAEAERSVSPGPWWWYRVFAVTDDASLRTFAGERLGATALSAPLLRQMARDPHAAALPAGVQRAITQDADERAAVRSRAVVALGAAVAVLVAAGITALWSAFRRRGTRRWLLPASHVLAFVSLAVVVVQCHFGPWRLPPASLGLAGLVAAALALLRLRTDRLGVVALLACLCAFVAGLAAENGWHEFASAIASMLTAAAAGALALQFARAQPRLRGLGWLAALPLCAAAVGGAAVGIEILVTGREVDDYTTAVQQASWAGWIAGTSLVGVVTFAVLLVVGTVVSVRCMPRAAHPGSLAVTH